MWQEHRPMIVCTTIFDICRPEKRSLIEIARTMGISVSQIYRVREGKCAIKTKFIVGAMQAFPNRRLDELFYVAPAPGGTEDQEPG